MAEPDDLILGCKRGKLLAQRRLYDKYCRAMLGVCRRYSNSEEEAEDAMIKGFMKVFERIGDYRGDGSFEGWMKRIMVHVSVDVFRQERRFSGHLSLDDPEMHVFTSNPSDQRLEVADLMALVQSLPEGQRVVFNLYAIEGYSHKEIGEMLEISENTSKTQLMKARSLLRRRLNGSELLKKNHHDGTV